MNINDISPDEIQNITPPKPININDINENEIEAVSLPMPEPQPQAEPTGMTNEIRQTLAPEVEPDLSLFQRFAGGPVGDALAGIGNIARQSQTVSPEALAVVQQQTVIPSKEEVAATLINNAQQGAQAIRNVPTAVGGLAAMIPSFATDIARGGTDILAGGAEMLGADQLGGRIREEGKLAADTAKQLAAESTANLRQFYEGKPTDVEGEMLAEELQPSKKQGALAKAMTTKFLWDAENMPPDAFKAKYPEALPIDTFNAKFEEVLRGQSLPQTVKSFFFDMPLESVKTIYGAIAGDPEVRQRFIERPAETIVETGVGLGIGIKGTKELLKATGDIARKATVFEKPQTIDEAAASKMQSEREMTDFLRKNTEQRDAMREQSEAMTGAPNRGMSAEELASTMREPAPQNMEATTEFLTRKPAVTFGEAERLQGEAIPEGRGGMTIGPRRPAVTFGGEGERTGEAIPESKGMTVQPTAPTNKLDQLFKRKPSRLDNYVKDFAPRDKTRIKNQLQTIDKIADEYGNIEILYDEKGKPQYKLSTKDGKEYRRINKTEYEYLKSIGKEAIEAKKPLQFSDLENMSDEEILAIPELELEKVARAESIPFRDRVDFNIRLNKIKSTTPSPQPQQATEVAPKDITPQPAEPTAVKTPEIENGVRPSQKTFEMDTEYINADPKRFQYKTGTDAEGVTDLYKDVPFDEKQAGILTVWKDKDGKYYIIDGHHRLEMAKRSKVPTVDVRIANDYGINTEKEARLFGALKNISDGRGTAFDAAKIFKELNIDKLGDVKDFKINKKTAVAKQGFALSKLSDLVWEAARNNFIPEDIAAQLSVLDHTKQNSVYKLLAQRKKKTGEFPDKKTVSELADSVSTMDEGSFGETDMFGNIVETEPLIERSNIISYVQDSLKEEKKTFKIGSNKELAEKLATSQIGQLDKEKGAELLNKTLTTMEVFDNMKNIKGSKVADILNDSARKMAEGGNANLIKQEALKNVKTAIETEYSKYYEGDKPSSERGKATPDVREEVEEDLFAQPRPKSGPGMFGGATVQNAYEKVEPTLKKGADMLFKKGRQAYETVKRNADLTRDVGRVIDITEKEGRPVETEAPLRQGPRFIGGKPTQKGAFNPSSVIDAISSVVGGKKKERPFEVTIGDPALAKEFEKTFKATQTAETTKKQTAKAREQSVTSAYKQGLVDLFAPIIDRVPKGQEREKIMSIVHDIFYLGSPAEAFMRKTKDIVLDKVKHEDYASYMAAKAITTFREHIEKPDRIKLAEDFLKSIDPKTIKDYEKITNEWHEKAWKPILEELKASGLGDPLIINNIMGNENYAPFFPAKQLGLPHGIGENAPGAGIYKLKGGMGDYMDVLAAKMKKGIAMIAAAKINQGKLAAIDSMLQYDKSNIKEAIPEYKGFYKERDPLTGKMLEIPIVEFPEPQPGSGLALMEARRDGKKVGYYVPKEITRAFDMAMGEGDTLGATMRGFQKMTQGFRNVWIEYNPIWQVAVNAPRDIMASVIEMPKIGNKFKFMGNLAKVAPAAVGDYVPVLGKVVQAFTSYDRKKFEKDVTKALGESKLMSTREPQYLGETDTTVGEGLKRAYGLTEKHTGIAKALDTIQEFGKDIERMTKIAANLTLEGDKRFSDPEVKNIVRQIGSPAFGVRGGGDLFKIIKTATMFYNATKQSWVAAKYFLEKDPVGAIAFASVPMGLYAATIAAENGVFGDDMEKAYTLMKGYDKENKLNFPIGYKGNGEVEYISLPLPQFLKPVMRIMRTAAKENPKFLDSIIKGFSEELPMLNPVVGLINRITSYGDEKPPAAELSGQEIMTQDQWDAGGAIKGTAFLKAFWNDYLLGSQIRLKVKPNERNETWEDKAIRFVFGKVYKTNFNEDLDTSATRQKQALQRLKTREAATAETPQEQQKIIQDMVKEGYTPQKNVFKNVKQRQFVENLRKTNAPAARQMEIYLSGKSKEEKIKAFQKLNDLLKKKKK
jgi:hypothetical protein